MDKTKRILKDTYDIIIIGAGASGLLAAGKAAEGGKSILLLEKMERPGRKINISGKGRCNVSNSKELPNFIAEFSRSGSFLYSAFSQFFNTELVELFESLGVPLEFERGDRIFPKSSRAMDITDALEKWVKKSNLTLLKRAKVTELTLNPSRSKIKRVHFEFENQIHHISCKKCIIATGGLSYPATGSTGDGYGWAKELGHSIIPQHPSLVPLIFESPDSSPFGNVKLKNVKCTLHIGKQKTSYFGELYLFGQKLAGPISLKMSKQIIPALLKGKIVSLNIDLKPSLDEQKLKQRFLKEIQANPKWTVNDLLTSLLPQALIPYFLKEMKIKRNTVLSSFSKEYRNKLIQLLKNITLNITGYADYTEAIITAGGIDTKEIDPKTMQSKIVENVYFCGEVINIDASTGGYNLQAAFSTGWVAGKWASE